MTDTAGNPYPTDGDLNGTSPNVELRWIAGDRAASASGHDLFFGTDRTAVLNGDPSAHIGPQTITQWMPPALTEGTTYYWRVDEINPAVAPYRWVGSVWSFVTFDSNTQPANYQRGYATWLTSAMSEVSLTDSLPDGSPDLPVIALELAQCESCSFQLAIQPSPGRRLDTVRLVCGDLLNGTNTLSADNVSWQLLGTVIYGGARVPDILLPVSHFNMEVNATHSVLVTVTAPAGTPPGIYSGSATVTTDSGLDTAISISANVYPFAIPAASTVGSMNLRTTWTLNDFGDPVRYQQFGDCLLSYRMGPDNIYRNATPDIATLEHWHQKGLNTFSVYKADNLWHTGDLQNQGVDAFFTALAASPLGRELRHMAQFYGYDEKNIDSYGDASGQSGMRATYGTIKAAYPDIPTTTTARIYVSPWSDPIGDMTHYQCDWMCAEQTLYTYTDGELLRRTPDPGLPAHQRFQYWTYSAGFGVGKLLTSRSFFWNLFQQRADGFLYYSVNGWIDPVSGMPSTLPIDPAAGPLIDYLIPGKSAGTLLYYGTTGPLASIRMANIRDGMQDWEYLWAIGHYDTDGVSRLGKIASVETARELAEQISAASSTALDPSHLLSARRTVAAWLSQPHVARYPTPEHRSKGVSHTPTLTWQADSPSVSSFDIYFGSDANLVRNATHRSPEFRGNRADDSYTPPGPLARNTDYYWRIDEIVSGQTYKGYVWSFNCSFGLVGWWKLDETAGSVAKDWSTLGHDSNLVGATHIPGAVNNGLLLAGTGRMTIPSMTLSTVDREITITIWLHGADSQPQNQVLLEALTASGSTVLRVRAPAANSSIVFEAGLSDQISAPASLTQVRSRWQHWTFTKNANTGRLRIYLNGALFAEATGKTEALGVTTLFTVGSQCNHSLGYEGALDELRIYDGELQPADIQAIYAYGGRRGDCGLMGWWRFDELSGSTARDWSDLENHGTLRSMNPLHDPGRVGNALTCNGASDYVDVPVKGLTFSDPAVTLALWTYGDPSLPNAGSNYGSIVVSALKPDATTSLLGSIPFSDTAFFRAGGDSGADTKMSDPLAANQYKGQWNHWVFARNSAGQSTIYVNGGPIKTDANTSGDKCASMAQLRIGTGSSTLSAYPFLGKLDEVRLYNYEVGAADVAAMYASDLTQISGEIGRWKFEDGHGTTAADATSLGHDATLQGASWAPGRINGGVSFKPIHSNITVPAAALYPLNRQVTITLWLRGPATLGHDNCIFEALDDRGGPVIRVLVGARGVTFDAGFGGANHFDHLEHAGSGIPIPGFHGLRPHEWSHWAFTKDAIGGLMQIYFNGAPWAKSRGNYRSFTRTHTFVMGSRVDGSQGFKGGSMDDVRIFNMELSPVDIRNIYLDCPPLPNPMTWAEIPRTAGPTSITMKASTATHPSGVEYYFSCISGGGHDSGWQASPTFTDAGLTPLRRYTYRVIAREIGVNHNETAPSAAESAVPTLPHIPP